MAKKSKKSLQAEQHRLLKQLEEIQQQLGTEGEVIARTQAQVASFFGISVVQVRSAWVSAGMPGKPGRYPLDQIAKWLRKDGPWRAQAAGSAQGAAEPSSHLERFRDYRARNEELEYQKKIGTLIERQTVLDLFSDWTGILKRTASALRSRHGRAAEEIMREALDDCKKIVSVHTGAELVSTGGSGKRGKRRAKAAARSG